MDASLTENADELDALVLEGHAKHDRDTDAVVLEKLPTVIHTQELSSLSEGRACFRRI